MAQDQSRHRNRWVVQRVYNESQLEETLNEYCELGYDVHQIFLRSFFVPVSQQRQMYYAVIFRRNTDGQKEN